MVNLHFSTSRLIRMQTKNDVAIITDIHFGCRGDSAHFHDYMERFFRDEFFPEVKRNGITTIICLGDIFDVRKTINFYTLSRVKTYFFNRLKEEGLELIILVGNHDVYFKNSNEINSPDLLLREYPNIKVIWDKPETLTIKGTKISFIPWINNATYESVLEFIKNDSATICFAHLELEGFYYHAGVKADHGMQAKIFENYDTVLTGHYHTKSSNGNVHYLGTMFDLTWADVDDRKYWHLFDPTASRLTPIENQNRMFVKMVYNDSDPDFESAVKEFDFSHLEGKYVKLIVEKKDKPVLLDMMTDKIHAVKPIDLSIVDNTVFGVTDELQPEMLTQDTPSILQRAVEILDVDVDKGMLYNMLLEVYTEANAVC